MRKTKFLISNLTFQKWFVETPQQTPFPDKGPRSVSRAHLPSDRQRSVLVFFVADGDCANDDAAAATAASEVHSQGSAATGGRADAGAGAGASAKKTTAVRYVSVSDWEKA